MEERKNTRCAHNSSSETLQPSRLPPQAVWTDDVRVCSKYKFSNFPMKSVSQPGATLCGADSFHSLVTAACYHTIIYLCSPIHPACDLASHSHPAGVSVDAQAPCWRWP